MMQRPVTRVAPGLPPGAFQTYQVLAPQSTHFRKATCEEVGCEPYRFGWKTLIDGSTEMGQRQIDYITQHSGRRYIATKTGPTTIEFVFEAGQECFGSADHKVRVGKPELYVVRDGDWRKRTGSHRRFTGRNAAEDWVDHFRNHQDRLATDRERG